MLEKYISVDELDAILKACKSLQPFWETLTGGIPGGVSFECESFSVEVFDCNGEKLGDIAWSDAGAAFYAEGQPSD